MRPALCRYGIVLVLLLCACRHNYRQKEFRLVAEGISEEVHGAVVTRDFFPSFGVRPYLGRFFIDNGSQRDPVTEVVLSYGIWQRIFHRRPDVIGSTLELDGRPALIVGVAEPRFAPFGTGELWILTAR